MILKKFILTLFQKIATHLHISPLRFLIYTYNIMQKKFIIPLQTFHNNYDARL